MRVDTGLPTALFSLLSTLPREIKKKKLVMQGGVERVLYEQTKLTSVLAPQ